MPSLQKKWKKEVVIQAFILLAFAGIGAILLYQSIYKVMYYEKTTAQIVEQRKEGTSKRNYMLSMVQFIDNHGKLITEPVNIGKSYDVGDKVILYYNNNPTKSYDFTPYSFSDFFIFPFVWNMSVLIMSHFVIKNLRSEGKRASDIDKRWIKIQGIFPSDHIEKHNDPERRVNAKADYYYTIKAEAVDPFTKETRVFISEEVSKDPTADFANAKTIAIYVNPDDSKEYWMDFDDVN